MDVDPAQGTVIITGQLACSFMHTNWNCRYSAHHDIFECFTLHTYKVLCTEMRTYTDQTKAVAHLSWNIHIWYIIRRSPNKWGSQSAFSLPNAVISPYIQNTCSWCAVSTWNTCFPGNIQPVILTACAIVDCSGSWECKPARNSKHATISWSTGMVPLRMNVNWSSLDSLRE